MYESDMQCLLMRTGPYQLLLPYGSIAHIFHRPEIMSASVTSAWHMGHSLWQKQRIQVVCFDKLLEKTDTSSAQRASYLVILEAFHSTLQLGIVIDKAPQSLSITPDAMIEERAYPTDPLVHYCVFINGERVLIPNITALARILMDQAPD